MAEKIKLADLIASLGLDPKEFIKGVEKVRASTNQMAQGIQGKAGQSITKLGERFKSAGAGIATAGAKMASVATVAGAAIGGLALAGVAGLGVVTKKAFELAQSAAPLQGASAAFRSLTADIEGGSQAMLASLQRASNGLISNTNLMLQFNKAAQLISTDFAKQLPGAMEALGKVAAATGEDMTFLLDSLTVGVGRLSPMILDNLSIQVDLNQAYQDFADKNGLIASELSKSQQQAALMAQVTDKLAQNTAQLPSVYGSASQAFGAFGTDIQNVRDAMGLDLLPTFTELVNAGRSLMPAFQSIGQGLAGTFAGIVEVGKQFTRGLLQAFGVDFTTIANNSGKWGQNIVVQFARGMASALGAIIQVLNEIGKIITYWLQPHSPPKLLPNLDKWGMGAADVYFEGWTKGNVSVLRDLSKQAESFIRSSMAGADSGEIASAVMNSRKAIESAIKGGGNILQALPKQLQAYGSALVSVSEAETLVANAQNKLNQVTAKYNQLLAPVNEELSEIAKRRQEIIDNQRKAELESIISDESAPALAKELAQMELREIELNNQKNAIEDQKDTAVNAAQEELSAAQTLLDQQKEKLSIQQQLLQQEQETLDLQNSTLAATDALTSATEGLGGAMGGLSSSLGGIGSSLTGLMPLGTALGSNMSELAGKIKQEFALVGESAFDMGLTWGNVTQTMRKWWNDNVNTTIEQSPLLSWLNEHIPTALDFLSTWWGKTWELMITTFKKRGDEFFNRAEFFMMVIREDIPATLSILRKFWDQTFLALTKAAKVAQMRWLEFWEEAKEWLSVKLKDAVLGLMGDWLTGFSAISQKTTDVKGVVESFWESVKGLWQWLKDHVFSFNIQTPSFPSLPGGGGEPTDRQLPKDAGQGLAPSFPSAGLYTAGGGNSGVTVSVSGNTINDPMDLQTVVNAVVSAVRREMQTGV